MTASDVGLQKLIGIKKTFPENYLKLNFFEVQHKSIKTIFNWDGFIATCFEHR